MQEHLRKPIFTVALARVRACMTRDETSQAQGNVPVVFWQWDISYCRYLL